MGNKLTSMDQLVIGKRYKVTEPFNNSSFVGEFSKQTSNGQDFYTGDRELPDKLVYLIMDDDYTVEEVEGLDSLIVGDELQYPSGGTCKILGKCGEVFFISGTYDKTICMGPYTLQELREVKLTLKTTPKEYEVDVVVEGNTTKLSRQSAINLGLIKE